jgi:uncharacterized OsmC-like protein
MLLRMFTLLHKGILWFVRWSAFLLNKEETTMAPEKTINGVNVDQLFANINLLREKPDLAKFKFRATNIWIDGSHNCATVKDFYGAGQEDTSRNPMVFDLDEPPALLGRDLGANPVEYLLVALSGCITTALITHASAKGIALKKVESRYEGDIDLRGFLAISADVPVGYQDIRVYFKIDADITEAEKEELIRRAHQHSPVAATISQTTPVSVHLDKK